MASNIYTYLHWNAPLNKQEIAMNELASRNDIDPRRFLQPVDKGYWENAAKVLYKMGYPKIKDAVPGIFIWIQDMTWPGAFIAVQILELLPKDVFLQNLENAVKEALNTNDESWIYNMQEFIKHLWVNEKEHLSKEVYLTLLDGNFSGRENNYSTFKEL